MEGEALAAKDGRDGKGHILGPEITHFLCPHGPKRCPTPNQGSSQTAFALSLRGTVGSFLASV